MIDHSSLREPHYFPPQQSLTTNPMHSLLPAVSQILAKPGQTRTNTDSKQLHRFTKTSTVLCALAEITSEDVSRNILRYAQVHDIQRSRIIMQKGTPVETVVILLKGKFGVIGAKPKTTKPDEDSVALKILIENSLKISRELHRTIKETEEHPSHSHFKTLKASISDLRIGSFLENQECIFNLDSLAEAKKYTETLVSCSNCAIMTIPAKAFYEILASFMRKLKEDKISAFRKFTYFNCIDNERLIHFVDELPLLTVKKGHLIYKEGEELQYIYLLLRGNIKLTKTVDLFREDPNYFYLDRKAYSSQTLPFADFSSIFNYMPRAKILEIGITGQMGIFGEEEIFCHDRKRRVNAQVCSETAVFYQIDLDKFDGIVPDFKLFLEQFKAGLFEDQTRKKILYRQEKLSELLLCETKNNMDYFFIQDNPEAQQSKKVQSQVRKYKINKVNQLISPTEKPRPPRSSKNQALYNIFNFDQFPIKEVASTPKPIKTKNSSFGKTRNRREKNEVHYTPMESKVLGLVHTVGVRAQTADANPAKRDDSANSFRKYRSCAKTDIQIDIHHPLFAISYFEKPKRDPRLPFSPSVIHQSRAKSTTSRSINLSYIF